MPELGSPPPERCTLTVKQLKRVVNDRPILQDISFAITTGEVLFVRGPSGVGKSLLLRCLAHLDPIQVWKLSSAWHASVHAHHAGQLLMSSNPVPHAIGMTSLLSWLALRLSSHSSSWSRVRT